MPAKDVKAYVKRNKNDAADAEAICEAVRRPTMRFVQIKSTEQQGRLMLHRAAMPATEPRAADLSTLRRVGCCRVTSMKLSSLLARLRAVSPTAFQTKNYRSRAIACRRHERLPPN